jgi:mono/diheme cytochrome c family protein
MKISFAVALATLAVAGAAFADGLTPGDDEYLQKLLGLTPQSAVLTELTPNEQQSLHSAIDDLKTYPDGQARQVKRYLALAYTRECKRWAAGHPGQNCSPASDPAVQPGKLISDKICASCHLFGTDGGSFHEMANEKDWNPHRVEHALHHTAGMVPIKLTQEQLNALTAYVNSFKGN